MILNTLLTLLAMQVPASADDIAKVAALSQAAYSECVYAAAIRLDNGRESAEVLSHAGITSCKEEHNRYRMSAALYVQASNHVDAKKAVDIAIRMDGLLEKQIVDEAVVRVLENRKAK